MVAMEASGRQLDRWSLVIEVLQWTERKVRDDRLYLGDGRLRPCIPSSFGSVKEVRGLDMGTGRVGFCMSRQAALTWCGGCLQYMLSFEGFLLEEIRRSVQDSLRSIPDHSVIQMLTTAGGNRVRHSRSTLVHAAPCSGGFDVYR
jgi:hypothetical protein